MKKNVISKKTIKVGNKHYTEEKYWAMFPSDRIITARTRSTQSSSSNDNTYTNSSNVSTNRSSSGGSSSSSSSSSSGGRRATKRN